MEYGVLTPQDGIAEATGSHWDWALARAARPKTRKMGVLFMFVIQTSVLIGLNEAREMFSL